MKPQKQKGIRDFDAKKAFGRNLETNIFFNVFFPLRWLYSYVTPVIVKGFFKSLEMKDIPGINKGKQIDKFIKRFDWWWNKLKNNKNRTAIACFAAWGIQFSWAGLLYVIQGACTLASPLLLKEFLEKLVPMIDPEFDTYLEIGQNMLPPGLVEESDISYIKSFFRTDDWQAWAFLASAIITMVAGSLLTTWGEFLSTSVGAKVRASLTTKIFEKSLKIPNKVRIDYDKGKILNLITADLQNLEQFYMYVHMLWPSITVLVGSIVCIFLVLDWRASLFALISPVLALPLMCILIMFFGPLTKKIMEIKDARVKKISEFVEGIKVIKFFGWEEKLLKRIEKVRGQEVGTNFFVQVLSVALLVMFNAIPIIMSCTCFIVLYFVDGGLNPIDIFTSLTYFSLLQFQVIYLPMILNGAIRANVSVKRIADFLEQPELEDKELGTNTEYPIIVKKGTFEWDKKEKEEKKIPKWMEKMQQKKAEKEAKKNGKELEEVKEEKPEEIPFVLKDINVEIKKGELIMICGQVGSGKSSFFEAILGNMPKKEGEIEISAPIAYCAQKPWVLNATLLDNILFGKELNEEKWKKIITSCCLDKDIEILKGGRMIEIGENASTVSGGQAARISLGRLLYQEPELCMIDSILSAVDAHVGKKIFDECICGLLKNSTRLMITHQVHVLEKADKILYIGNNTIEEQGSFNELMSKKGKFYELIINNTAKKDEENEENENNNKENENEVLKTLKKKKEEKEKGKLMEEEEKEKGAVKLKTYFTYFNAGKGLIIIPILFIFFIIVQLFQSGQSWWLSEWANGTWLKKYGTMYNTSVYLNTTTMLPQYWNDSTPCPSFSCYYTQIEAFWDQSYNNGTVIQEGMSHLTALLIYTGFGIGGIIINFFKTFFVSLFCLLASMKLHKVAMRSISKAPQEFFDTNPLGRLVNRFSADILIIDFQVANSLSSSLVMLFSVIGVFVLISYSTNALFIVFLIPIIIIFIIIYILFRKSNIEIKRLNNISRSPLIANIQETLSGITSIKAYRKQNIFKNEVRKRIDYYNTTYWTFIASKGWLFSRLNLIGTLITLVVCVICVLVTYYAPSSWGIQLSYMSLACTYANSISRSFAYMFQQWATTEGLFSSVERINHYCKNIKQEKPRVVPEIDNKLITEKWPQKGQIQFQNYSMRYREGLPLVLDNINLTIKAGERIGICGRTGSGKSSMLLSLFRIVESANGSILIDNQDISQIGTKKLRTSLSIIPQDPVLFCGSIRSNIDMFEEYSDEQIWEVLEKINMKSAVEKAGGLNGFVQEGGKNFSQGERQLLCACRAFVKKSKILVLDECTSSVDVESDKVVQQSIKDLENITILTIAHRLRTIIDYDRVLVLEKGKIAEFDTPKNLLTQDKYHIFSDLIDETGKSNSLHLRTLILGTENKVQQVQQVQEKITKVQIDVEAK